MFSTRFDPLRGRVTRLLAAAGMASAFAGLSAFPAQAQPLSTKTFSYADMPDLDQQRSMGNDAAGVFHPGLPNSGKMYCGPTSALDALAFLADHGASGMGPGSGDWRSASNYDRMTSRLSEMGGLMSTDASNGTTQGNFESGLQAWNTRYGRPVNRSFGIVSEFPGPDNDWQAPNLGVAALAEGFGNPVIVRIGYYDRTNVTVGGKTISVLKRTGGHWVAMTGFDDSGLNFMDPVDSPAAMSQSDYRNRAAAVSPTNAVFAWGDGTLQQPQQTVGDLTVYPTETYLKLSGWDASNAYVEGYTVLQPSYRLTAKRSILQIWRKGIQVRFHLAGGSVRDVAISPLGEAAYYTLAGSSKIYRLNFATGKSTALARLGSQVSTLAVNNADDTVYAAAGRGVAALATTGGLKAKINLPRPVDALAFDPTRDQIDAVSADAGRVTVLGSNLKPSGAVRLATTALKGASTVTASVTDTGRLQMQRGDSGLVLATSTSSMASRLQSLSLPAKSVGVSRLGIGSHRELQPSGQLLNTNGLQEIVRESRDIPAIGQQADQLAG